MIVSGVFQEQGGEVSREHVERLYIFALMWSVGALLELEDRRKMESWLRSNDSIHLDLPDIPLDSEDTMFDYHVTADGEGTEYRLQTPGLLFIPYIVSFQLPSFPSLLRSDRTGLV